MELQYSFTYGANWISPSTPYVKATSNELTAGEFPDGTILTIPAISSKKQEGAYQEVKFKLLPDGKW
jgi:hypothetical protein